MPKNLLDDYIDNDNKRTRDGNIYDNPSLEPSIETKLLSEDRDRLTSIEEKYESLDEKYTILKEKYKTLDNRSGVIEKRLEKSQTQYITILGIFASVILAFVGSFVFSTSVLSHMHEVSIYRLTFAVSCIAFLFFNLICVLLDFILKVSDKNEDKDKKSNQSCSEKGWSRGWTNEVLLFIIIISFVLCLLFEERKSENPLSTANNNFICLQSQPPKSSPKPKTKEKNTKQTQNQTSKQEGKGNKDACFNYCSKLNNPNPKTQNAS